MDRRTFLRATGMIAAAPLIDHTAVAAAQERQPFSPRPGEWRAYEISTRVDVQWQTGTTQVWLPLPMEHTEYQRAVGNTWSGNARTMQVVTDGKYGARMLYAEFAPDERAPTVELTSRIRAQDRALDWSRRAQVEMDVEEAKFWTAATELMPTDGIVRKTAQEVTRGKRRDIDQVRAVYDWIVVNTYREPKVRGCGVGDIRAMLETGNLGGKCGDINALFVGLVRSVGIPARDVYGIRVGPSAFGYRALGANSADATRAQHCRAEVFLRDYGWVAMDPADVGKVAREETSEWLKDPHHPLVSAVRPKLFGGWEGNWLGFNVAHDIALPNSKGPRLGFLMYPQAETADGRLDSLDPENFRYRITARALGAA
jgi:transglutaminase-like putative cysteine protease